MGYALGLFSTGFVIGKIKKIDIRQYGSGNTGMTNMLRTLGLKAGLATLLGDAGKAIIAIILAWAIYSKIYPDGVYLLMLYAGLGAVLGHNFPFYFKFKGGKGIACTLGVIIAFYPPMAILCLAAFAVVAITTKYFSLASLFLISCFFIQLVIFGQMGIFSIERAFLPEIYVLGAIFAALGFIRHRENIIRLKNGTENKFHLGHKK